MIQNSTQNALHRRAHDRGYFGPHAARIHGSSTRCRHNSDDEFATVGRSVDSTAIPVPLLLSCGKFPVRLGRYEILSRLGEGQMGSVFLARDPRYKRRIAIKISKLAQEQEAVDRFARESRVMANLQHPNICPAYDVGEMDGVRYFAMAYVEGKTLAECLAERSRLPGRKVAMLIRQVAIAIGAAHQMGVIHRDLKPANIMINPAGEPVIMDFGLTRSTDGGSIVTKNGVMLGTPAYMPPEQVLGHCELVGPVSDVYSLGVVMYQMLAGTVPFEGKLVTVLKQIISDDPPPPSRFRPQLDRRLEAICLKAMAKTTEQRFLSACELADALRGYLSGSVVQPM